MTGYPAFCGMSGFLTGDFIKTLFCSYTGMRIERAGPGMKRSRWNLRKQSIFLLAVVLLDGALLGAAGGAAGMCWPTHQSFAVPVTKRAEAAVGQQSSNIRPDQPVPSVIPKQIALTFDDGPHDTCTPKLLDGLKERGVQATFFLMGENIKGKEDLIRRMQAEGHLIGNHSYRHVQLTRAGEDAVCQSVEKTEQIIEEITGTRPLYLRPPYGDWNESLECRMDLSTVFWSIDSLDWKLKNTPRIVKRVVQRAEDGGIILMHDIFPTSVEAALQIVDQLQGEGYQFVTVDALMID